MRTTVRTALLAAGAAFCVPPLTQAADKTAESGFARIFDGSSLAGWLGDTGGYAAANGVLSSRHGSGGNLYTTAQYADFILRFEFRLTPGANNGIGLRAPLRGDAAYAAMECQVLDHSAAKFANLKPYQYHGSIYGVAAAQRRALKPVGEWNSQEIRCSGNQVGVTLNGRVILDANLADAAPGGKTIDGRDHPGLFRRRGHIGLLGHGTKVDFRNMRVKPLGG